MAEVIGRQLVKIDRAIDRALVVPRLRKVLPAETPAVVKEAVRRSLYERTTAAWQKDREVTRQRAQRARRHLPVKELTEPTVKVAWDGELPELPAERRMVLNT